MAVYPIILWDSVFLDGTVLANDTAPGYAAQNIVDYREFTYWKANSSGTNSLSVNCGSTTHAADAIAIIHHNLFTIGATIKVWCSTNSSFTTMSTLLTYVPTDNYAIFKTFTLTSSQYWKLQIESTGCPEIAICLLGTRLTFPSIPTSPVIPFSKGMEILTERSKSGFILGSIVKYKPVSISMIFPPAESNYTWWNGSFKTFWNNHASEMKPFFFGLDLTNFANDIFFVTIKPDKQYSLNMTSTIRVESFSLQMEGIAEV